MQLTVTRVLVRQCLHGIHLTGRNRNVIISDCHVYQNRGVGVFLDHVNLHQINVTGCHVSYNDGGGDRRAWAGEVRNLHVTGCDIESNHGKDRPADRERPDRQHRRHERRGRHHRLHDPAQPQRAGLGEHPHQGAERRRSRGPTSSATGTSPSPATC